MKSPSFNAVVSENRKAAFDYFLSDFLEVGIVLKGTEIKAIRKHKVSLRDTYIDFKDGEAFIINLHIPQYEKGNIFNHEPNRTRKILMHKREILRYSQRIQAESYTCVPTKVYFKNGRIKLSIALGKGKKHYDKREAIKERDDERDMQKATKLGRDYD
ncbi:MAG TPA: SsrA-binding protein SmpB [Bacilli bacterium]|nr:SsrA-binding protein SmpB [Bacilli bacterium]